MSDLRDLLGFRGSMDTSAKGAPPATGSQSTRVAGDWSDPIEFVRAVLARWPWVGLGTVLLSVACVLVIQRTVRPSYRSEAVLFVRSTAPSLAYTGEEWRAESIVGFYGDYVRTLKSTVLQRDLLERAIVRLESEGVEWLPSGVPTREAPDHLRARLDVSHVRDTYLIKVGLEDARPELPAQVVNAVTGVFLEVVGREENADARQRLETLEGERGRLEEALDRNQDGLDVLSEQTGVAVLDERQNVYYERLIRLQDGVTDVFVDRVRAEGRFEEQNELASELRGKLPAGLLDRMLDEDTAVRDARLMLQRLIRDLESETGELSEEHPQRTQALERIEGANERLAEFEARTRGRLALRLQRERTEQADGMVLAARLDLERARRSEERMDEVVRQAEAELEGYARAVQDGKRLRAESGRLLAALDRVDSRIEELRVESKAPSRVSLRSPAIEPYQPVRDRRRVLCVVALACSAAVSMLLARAVSLIRRKPQGVVQA